MSHIPEEPANWTEQQAADIGVSIGKMVRAGSESVEAYSAIVSAAANLVAIADLDVGPNSKSRLNEFVRSVENNRAMIKSRRGVRLDG